MHFNKTLLLLWASCLLLLIPSSQAAPGGLDLGFGSLGKTVTNFNAQFDECFGVVQQSTGKLVAVGLAGVTPTDTDFGLSRYNTNGALDTTFGTSGKVYTNFGGRDSALDAVLLPEDKVLAVGRAFTGVGADFALAKYLSGGALDTTFGFNGKVMTDFNMGADQGRAVAIQPDGKIVVTGVAGVVNNGSNIGDIGLARYFSNGTLDPSFGVGGKTTTDINDSEQGTGIVIQPDGKIVVCAESGSGPGISEFYLIRYTSNGILDTSFNSIGYVSTSVTGFYDQPHDLVIQPDGKLIIGGLVGFDFGLLGDFGMVRYHPNGTLDTTFGTFGVVITDFANSLDMGWALTLQPDGKIILVGQVSGGFLTGCNAFCYGVMRYSANGILDASFSGDGMATAKFVLQGADIARSVLVQSDGKVVACGGTAHLVNMDGTIRGDFGLARFHG